MNKEQIKKVLNSGFEFSNSDTQFIGILKGIHEIYENSLKDGIINP